MDDICLKIEIVLNECTKYLCAIEKDEPHELLYQKILFEVSPIILFTFLTNKILTINSNNCILKIFF